MSENYLWLSFFFCKKIKKPAIEQSSRALAGMLRKREDLQQKVGLNSSKHFWKGLINVLKTETVSFKCVCWNKKYGFSSVKIAGLYCFMGCQRKLGERIFWETFRLSLKPWSTRDNTLFLKVITKDNNCNYNNCKQFFSWEWGLFWEEFWKGDALDK